MTTPRDTTTTREPLLSDEQCSSRDFWPVPWNDERSIGALNARAFYENLITSGELRVMGTTNVPFYALDEWYTMFGKTNCCGATVIEGANFCPKCAARIIP